MTRSPHTHTESSSPEALPRSAMERLEALQRRDTDDIWECGRTRLIEPSAPARATLVLWHGLSNTPAQFDEVADLIAERGRIRVLLPRLPRHGHRDVLTRELAEWSDEELADHVDECIDFATCFDVPVWTSGLSAGGVVAAWAGVNRPEVSRVALVSPFVAPKLVPVGVVRMALRHPHLVPPVYFWWDPVRKADFGIPYVYPGFPLPATLPLLRLAHSLCDRSVAANHTLKRAVLVTNPGDFAVGRRAARMLLDGAFGDCSETVAEVSVDRRLGWWHDFVDQLGPHHGPPPQVADVFLSALGIAEDPTASGALVGEIPGPDFEDLPTAAD